MNERLKELVISTGIYDSLCDPYDKHNTGDPDGSIIDDLEKFAKLLEKEFFSVGYLAGRSDGIRETAQECASICESMQLLGPYKDVQDATLKDAATQIKKHFVVKE